MKDNHSLLIIFLLLLAFNKVIAAEQIYYPAKKLPPEISYLLETVQSVPLSEANKNDLLQKLKNIDLALSNNNTSTLIIIKSELYKSILANIAKSKDDFDYTFTNPRALKKAKTILKSIPDKYSSFSLWLMENIIDDLEQVFLSPYYPQLLRKARRSTRIKDKRLVRIEQKLLTLLPIFDDFLNKEADEFNQDFIVQANKALDKVSHYCKSFTHVFQHQKASKPQPTLYYFQLTNREFISPYQPFKAEKVTKFIAKEEDKKEKKKKEEIVKPLKRITIAEKLDNIIKKEAEIQPIQPIAKWMPKEEFAPFPTPDPNYTPPKNLPRPINDWLTAKNLFLFPEPDENYIPPKVLPKPINDWLKEESKFTKQELPAAMKKIIEKTKRSILEGIPLNNDADDDWFLE